MMLIHKCLPSFRQIRVSFRLKCPTQLWWWGKWTYWRLAMRGCYGVDNIVFSDRNTTYDLIPSTNSPLIMRIGILWIFSMSCERLCRENAFPNGFHPESRKGEWGEQAMTRTFPSIEGLTTYSNLLAMLKVGNFCTAQDSSTLQWLVIGDLTHSCESITQAEQPCHWFRPPSLNLESRTRPNGLSVAGSNEQKWHKFKS